RSAGFAQEYMRYGTHSWHVPRALISQRTHVDIAQQVLASPEQHRRNDEVQLVDQPRLQILADRGDAAPESNVQAACRLARLAQRRLDAFGHEMEYRSSV